MPRKKCPACGSTKTIKILYDLPTYEAFQSAERGEIALGGCCVIDNSPQRHCQNCGQDFAGLNFIELASLDFFVGGYFTTSYYIYINGTQKTKFIRYTETTGGVVVDLIHPKNTYYKELILSDIQWLEFIKDLNTLEIICWNDEYFDNNICDGIQWELNINADGNKKISKSGSNEYPPYWNKFIKILNKYIGDIIHL